MFLLPIFINWGFYQSFQIQISVFPFLPFLKPFSEQAIQYLYKENNLTFEHFYQIIKI